MVAHNIYIFDRDGVCLYYHEWLRTKPVSEGAGNQADDQKGMFGLFFSLKTFTAAMDPKAKAGTQLGAPLRIGESCSFWSFRANNYKLHFFETLSGLKFVMNTDENAGDLRELMHYVYTSIYVELVTKNPLNQLGQPFNYNGFTKALNQHLRMVNI